MIDRRQINRIRQLATAGLSAEAIARVIDIDYGQRPPMALVKDQVRRVAAGRRAITGSGGPRLGVAGVSHQAGGFHTGQGTRSQEVVA